MSDKNLTPSRARTWPLARNLPVEAATSICECFHDWYVHFESGQTGPDAICHGYTGNATPGPYEPCRCTGFRPWSGPRDARTGEPVRPLSMMVTALNRPAESAAPRAGPSPDLDAWDFIIDALQFFADESDDAGRGQVASDLAVLLRNQIDRLHPGTYGGCDDDA